jgi:hypothetical protein
VANDDLIQSLDASAKALLERAQNGDMNGENKILPTIGEQVRVFESIAKWAELRLKLNPPQRKEGKFDAIRKQFSGNGATGRKGRRRGIPAETEEDGDDTPQFNS